MTARGAWSTQSVSHHDNPCDDGNRSGNRCSTGRVQPSKADGIHSRYVVWFRPRGEIRNGPAGHGATSCRARDDQDRSVDQLENLPGDRADVGSAGSPHVGSADDEEVGAPIAHLCQQKRGRVAF